MELFFRKFGQGPALIIIHGLYGSSDNWFTIGKKLSEHFEVFLIDQRNHGQSPHSEEHCYECLKEDLLEFMNQHAIDKAVIIGHSMGGKTAMYFSKDYPERITSLVVVDISPLSYLKATSTQLLQHNTILNALNYIDFSKISSREQVDEILSETIPQKYVRQFLLKNIKRTKDNKFYWGINIKTLKNKLFNIIDGFDIANFEGGKSITGFPVLFIRGEKSEYILKGDIEAIAKIYPYADLETIPNAGHWVHAEQPEIFLKSVLQFLLP